MYLYNEGFNRFTESIIIKKDNEQLTESETLDFIKLLKLNNFEEWLSSDFNEFSITLDYVVNGVITFTFSHDDPSYYAADTKTTAMRRVLSERCITYRDFFNSLEIFIKKINSDYCLVPTFDKDDIDSYVKNHKIDIRSEIYRISEDDLY